MRKKIAVFVFSIICISCKGVKTLTRSAFQSVDVKNLYEISDTISLTDKDSFSLILNSFYFNDSVKVLGFEDCSYTSPLVQSQSLIFTYNGRILKRRKINIKKTYKQASNGRRIYSLKTPIYKIGVVDSNSGLMYIILGSDFCNGANCWEFIGLYNRDGVKIFEGVVQHKRKRIRDILKTYAIEINRWRITEEISDRVHHE